MTAPPPCEHTDGTDGVALSNAPEAEAWTDAADAFDRPLDAAAPCADPRFGADCVRAGSSVLGRVVVQRRAVVYVHGGPTGRRRPQDPLTGSSLTFFHGSDRWTMEVPCHEPGRGRAWRPMAVAAQGRLDELRSNMEDILAPSLRRWLTNDEFVHLDDVGNPTWPTISVLSGPYDVTDPDGRWSPAWARAALEELRHGRPFVPHPQHPERTAVTLALESAWIDARRLTETITRVFSTHDEGAPDSADQAAGMVASFDRAVSFFALNAFVHAMGSAAVFVLDGCVPSAADAQLFDRVRAHLAAFDPDPSEGAPSLRPLRERLLFLMNEAVRPLALGAALDRAVLRAMAGGGASGGARRM